MHPIFYVSPADVALLNDSQARELVARLCRAECLRIGASESSVEWGGDQKAADGGVDVSVSMNPSEHQAGFLPSHETGFQVKAEKSFPASKIYGEMCPDGELRETIRQLAKKSGAYVIVSTKENCAKETSLKKRISAMTKVLERNGLHEKLKIEFYHQRKLADWIEQYPAIAVWVKHSINQPISGWQPYRAWAYHESDVNAEYCVDERLKVITPNCPVGTSVLDAILELRETLVVAGSSVRLVGLSGVGKTRLVQALFDDRIGNESSVLSKNSVIYTDLSDQPSPQPNAMIQSLAVAPSRTLLIVDNCGAALHSKLVDSIKSNSSSTSLLTIEYDIKDDLPDATAFFRLDSSSDEIIRDILFRKFPSLSQVDIETATKFAGGNARLALALAGTCTTTGELAQLQDEALFRRLFFQQRETDSALLNSAETCSLLYSFDFEETTEGSELETLAGIAEVSVSKLFGDVRELENRGLVQRRGRWRAVLPHAISNRLAAKALRRIPPGIVEQLLTDSTTNRVTKSFAHRLGFLHQSEQAQRIVLKWLAPGGRMGNLSRLSEDDYDLFIRIAPVNQKATLDAVFRCLSEPLSEKDLYLVDRFSQTTRSLAYEPDNFDRAIEILIRFALLRIQDNSQRDLASETICTLFYPRYSGTHATIEQRATVIQQLLSSSDEDRIKLGCDLLAATLKTEDLQVLHSFEFGAHQRDFGWRAKTDEEFKSWFKTFVSIAQIAGGQANSTGLNIRHKFAQNFPGLWERVGICNELEKAAEKFHSVDGWADGWNATRLLLSYADELPEESKAQLKSLCEKLKPSELTAEIRAKVLSDWSYSLSINTGNGVDSWTNYCNEFKQLGIEFGKEASWSQLLPELLSRNDSQFVSSFAVGVGSSVQDIRQLFDKAKTVWYSIEEQSRAIQFMTATFCGWAQDRKKEETTDALLWLLQDETWGQFFPAFEYGVPLDDSSYERLKTSLELGFADASQYFVLHYPKSENFNTKELGELLNLIAAKEEGKPVVAATLAQMTYGSEEKPSAYRARLLECSIQFLKSIDESVLSRNEYSRTPDFVYVVAFVLKEGVEEEFFDSLLERFLEIHLQPTVPTMGRGRFLEPFFEFWPRETIEKVYALSESTDSSAARRLIRSFDNYRRENPMTKAPVDQLLGWCKSDQGKIDFLTNNFPVFANEKNLERHGETLGMSELFRELFNQTTAKNRMLDLIKKRVYPSSWSGSLARIIRLRTQTLDELKVGQNQQTVEMVAAHQEELLEFAKAEELRESETDKRENERFE